MQWNDIISEGFLNEHLLKVRSSCLEVFCEKGALRNFTNFTGKHLCQSLFLIKLQASDWGFSFIKKSLWHRCFPVNLAKILRTPFLTEYIRQLLLKSVKTACVCAVFPLFQILWSKYFFKNNGALSNSWSWKKRINSLLKIWNYLVSGGKEKQNFSG